jgi:cell division septation protein DedD
MAENRRGKDNRFYFSRGQMVLLGGAFALASVVIFALGVFVGKGIEENKLMKREEPLVKIPVNPAGPAKTPARDEITFNDSVPKSVGVPVADEAKAKQSKSGETAIKTEGKDAKAPVKADAPVERTASRKAEKSAPAVETTGKAESDSPPQAKESGAAWRAQVNAFPDDRSAKQLVERLKNKGYNAYVTEVQNRGKTWYRVSVGKYNSREEAEKIVEALKSKEDYPKAFAATK